MINRAAAPRASARRRWVLLSKGAGQVSRRSLRSNSPSHGLAALLRPSPPRTSGAWPRKFAPDTRACQHFLSDGAVDAIQPPALFRALRSGAPFPDQRRAIIHPPEVWGTSRTDASEQTTSDDPTPGQPDDRLRVRDGQCDALTTARLGLQRGQHDLQRLTGFAAA